MSVYEKLAAVQRELKAPKGQFNSFGKYKYRSCEDILEALKPVLSKNGCAVVLSDSVEQVGDRFYICATATITDYETHEQVHNTAFAREDTDKKGMDGSQITGTASSYARKYALNGLFCIDDTKDADTDEYNAAGSQPAAGGKKPPKPQPAQKREAPVPKPQYAQEQPYICACCGKPLAAVTYKNRTVEPAETAASTRKKFGRVLCWTCAQKQPKEG